MKSANPMRRYQKAYDGDKLIRKLNRFAHQLGIQVVYQVLNMYYLLIGESKVPLRIRLLVMAALGYFILPADLISDFIPVFGFSDDLSFLTYAFGQAFKYMGPEIKNKSKNKLKQWFPKQAEEMDLAITDQQAEES